MLLVLGKRRLRLRLRLRLAPSTLIRCGFPAVLFVFFFEKFHAKMATFSLLIASLLFLANSTFAASNYFENPPDIGTATTNPSNFQVYKVGDILDVSWVTNANVVDLIINQKGTPNTEIDRPPNSGKW